MALPPGGSAIAALHEAPGLGRCLHRPSMTAVAVACPFCYIMMDDGVKELGYGDNVKVRDVSLILLDNLKKD